jgi:hypothetical protein
VHFEGERRCLGRITDQGVSSVWLYSHELKLHTSSVIALWYAGILSWAKRRRGTHGAQIGERGPAHIQGFLIWVHPVYCLNLLGFEVLGRKDQKFAKYTQ